jgi:hypothetical protein
VRLPVAGAFSLRSLGEEKPFIVSGGAPFDEGAVFLRQSLYALHSQRTKLRGEHAMQKKQKQIARKPSKKIADSRRVRYGASSAPRVVRSPDAAIGDSRAIRFGASSAPATLRK